MLWILWEKVRIRKYEALSRVKTNCLAPAETYACYFPKRHSILCCTLVQLLPIF
jgi:hypothetical protein